MPEEAPERSEDGQVMVVRRAGMIQRNVGAFGLRAFVQAKVLMLNAQFSEVINKNKLIIIKIDIE
jgi:hypothetical protein